MRLFVIPFALFEFQVRAAISTLQYHRDLPRLPDTFSVPDARNSDMLDLLQCIFGFQVSVLMCNLSIIIMCIFQNVS